MFSLSESFGIVAGFFSFSAYAFYITAIVRGETKPSRTTWGIWAVVGIILAFSYKASGADNTIWVAVSEAIAPTIIFLLSIKYGVGGTDKIDIICLLGSLFSLVLWWWSGSALVALTTNLSIDAFAVMPTITKSWRKPQHEDRFAWTLTETGNLLNLFAINQWTFGIAVYPLYMFVVDGIVTLILYRKKRKAR